MSAIGRFLSSRGGIIVTGLAVGVLAPILVKFGNPANMGVCVACFSRDIAGAMGLHRAAAVQYIRPEIIGFVLGSFIAALIFREFRPRTGASPLVKFLLGALAMIGALMFLGCPWRAFLRLSGGDWNALLGILGLAAGIAVGIVMLRMGFSLGRSHPAPQALGWIMPALMIGLLLLLIFAPQLGRDPEWQSHRADIFLGKRSRQPACADMALSWCRFAGRLFGSTQPFLHSRSSEGSDPAEKCASVQRSCRDGSGCIYNQPGAGTI